MERISITVGICTNVPTIPGWRGPRLTALALEFVGLGDALSGG